MAASSKILKRQLFCPTGKYLWNKNMRQFQISLRIPLKTFVAYTAHETPNSGACVAVSVAGPCGISADGVGDTSGALQLGAISADRGGDTSGALQLGAIGYISVRNIL